MAASLVRKKLGLPLDPLLIRFLSSPPCQSRSAGTLAFEELRSSPDHPYQSTAFLIHGLLGSARNWRSFSRNLLSSLPSPSDWRMVLVDLRNHGKSAEVDGLSPPHDLNNAAKDFANLVKSQCWPWPDFFWAILWEVRSPSQFTESCARGDYGESAALPKHSSGY